MRPLVEPHLQNLVPYVPGKPIEETEREYGITGIAKLASNENALGASPLALEAAHKALTQSHLYPDAGGFYLKQRLMKLHAAHDVTERNLMLGNGTNEIINLLVRAFVGPGEALLNAWPSFVCYRLAARACGREEIAVPLDDTLGYDLPAMAQAARTTNAKLVFIANPNNPTGRAFGADALKRFLDDVPADLIVVLDEAYAEYVRMSDYPDGLALAMSRPRTLVTRTFSKVYGLAGLRLGYAVGDSAIIDVLERMRDPFNTNQTAQAAAMAALDDTAHLQRTLAHNAVELPRMTQELDARGLDVVPSEGNFVLVHVKRFPLAAAALHEQLLRKGLIVRPVANYGLTDALRITIGTVVENERLLRALDDIAAEVKRG
jgi:histidinol-phosphate aminotransferase